MTCEEAFEILMSDKGEDIETEEFAEAYNMAVVALQEKVDKEKEQKRFVEKAREWGE